jgi:hypothetical protein
MTELPKAKWVCLFEETNVWLARVMGGFELQVFGAAGVIEVTGPYLASESRMFLEGPRDVIELMRMAEAELAEHLRDVADQMLEPCPITSPVYVPVVTERAHLPGVELGRDWRSSNGNEWRIMSIYRGETPDDDAVYLRRLIAPQWLGDGYLNVCASELRDGYTPMTPSLDYREQLARWPLLPERLIAAAAYDAVEAGQVWVDQYGNRIKVVSVAGNDTTVIAGESRYTDIYATDYVRSQYTLIATPSDASPRERCRE